MSKQITFTIPTASTIPNGGWYAIKNSGKGRLTLSGTVDGTVNPYLEQYDQILIKTNATVWKGRVETAVERGTALQVLGVTSDGKKVAYMASPQSIMTAAYDLLYASAANVPARHPKGTTPFHCLRMNAAATAFEWGVSLADSTATGTTLTLAQATTERTTTSATYVKLKETEPLVRGGVVTISFDLRGEAYVGGGGGYAGYGKVYKNNIEIGTEQSATDTYATKSENFTVVAGDVIQVYVHGTSSGVDRSAKVKNLYVKAKDPYFAHEATGY